MGRLITSGVLLRNDINNGLAVHPLVVGTKQVPAWLALWNWPQLNATDYAGARAALLDQLTRKLIVHPGEILHVVGTLLSLYDYGDDVVLDTEDYFLNYIDELQNGGTLAPNRAVFDTLDPNEWAGHSFQGNNHPTFEKVRAHLQKAVTSAHKLAMADAAKKLFHRLATPGSENALYEFDRKNSKYGGVALLQNIAVNDFADILLKDGVYDTQLITALHQRYKLGMGYPELLEEKTWLTDLEAEVRRRAVTAPAPFSLLLANRTNHWFGDIQKNINIIEVSAVA